jgi:multisubunit Na+/H+ antiporter MnhB subunit
MSDEGYSGVAFLGAVILTIWLPPAALIVALLALRRETNPRKRSLLRTWAWIAGVWVVVAVLLLVFALAGTGSGSGSS